MRIFVTGGSGFVGSHIIERLRGAHEVIAMARSDRSAEVVQELGATPIRADLHNVVAAHLMGCDAVVHCAAFVEEWGTREQFWEANVDGTTRMLEAARAAGVKRFIHIGTEAAVFAGEDLPNIDETRPYPVKQRYLYSETKAEAEKRVLAATAPGFTTISLRPRLVWGPRDATILPSILRMQREGAFAWLDGGKKRTSTTHVTNLSHAVSLALTLGEGGQSYFIADDGVRTMREFLTALLATQKVQLEGRSIPGAIARPVASTLEGAWRLLRIQGAPPMTAFAIAMMSREVTVDTSKAKRDLGYAPVMSVERGLAEL